MPRPDALEAACLDWQQCLDISRAAENAFEIHPAPLHVDPDVEESVDTVELLFPS